MIRILAFILAMLAATPAAATCSTGALPVTLQEGTTAHATDVMANFNQIVSGVASTCAGSGANNDITSLTGLTTPLTYTAGGASLYIGGTSGGAANAQTIATTTPTGFTLTAGKSIAFVAGFTNTAAMTLQVGATAATAVFRQTPSGAQAMTGGEVIAGNLVFVFFDGTQYQMVSNGPQFGGIGPLTNLSSAAASCGGGTVDPATIPSHNINITGNTNIGGFCSNASTTFPLYRFTFAGALTLQNAASFLLPGGANILTAANDTMWAMYLGAGNWQITSYQRANGNAVTAQTPLCGVTGMYLRNNLSGGAPNTTLEYSADSAVMLTTANVPIYRASGISGNLDTTTGGAGTSTANGMDGTARPASGWVHVYLIDNGTTTAALGSQSATAPVLPSGYTYACRVGTVRFDSSQNALRILQRGNRTQYMVTAGSNTARLPVLALCVGNGASCGGAGNIGGGIGAPTWQAVGISATVPPTATQVQAVLQSNGDGNTDGGIVAPNTAYGGVLSTTIPPPCAVGTTAAAAIPGITQCLLTIETISGNANIFWAAHGNGAASYVGLSAAGYIDKVNAQ